MFDLLGIYCKNVQFFKKIKKQNIINSSNYLTLYNKSNVFILRINLLFYFVRQMTNKALY